MQDLRDCVLELVKNSIEADSTFIKITVFQRDAKRLVLQVEDNGCGMSDDVCAECQSPFYSTKGKDLGMGLPLIKDFALRTGGDFVVESTEGSGTTVSALFKPYNINMIPIGDIYQTTLSLIRNFSDIDFVLCQKTGNRNITVDSRCCKRQVM
ncbi:MAG: ATP-binding protein [Acutalibacteraceae bacterium]|nr:ATP-binding protein [Acutalibacteraceae bacterium]